MKDRTPAPAPLRRGPRDSLCDEDEVGNDVHPFMRRHCPHELWLALDLDSFFVGDGEREDEREDKKAWKWKGHYNDRRFTLRVSWPASVSRPVPQLPLALTLTMEIAWDHTQTLTCDPPFPPKASRTGRAQSAPSPPAVALRSLCAHCAASLCAYTSHTGGHPRPA